MSIEGNVLYKTKNLAKFMQLFEARKRDEFVKHAYEVLSGFEELEKSYKALKIHSDNQG